MLKIDIKNVRKFIFQNISCYGTILRTIHRNISGKKFESEVYVLDKFVFPGSVCFDIGAAYGRYALNMSKLVGNSGRIYCFEPGSYSYKVLFNIVRFHQLKNVIIIKKALFDKEDIAELVIPIKEKGKLAPSLAHLSSGYNASCITEKIEVTTLDNYCSGIGVPKLDFIKCDVEGAELLVFKGAKNMISYYRPIVLCEIDVEYLRKFNSSPEEIYDFFCQRGYKSFILKEKRFEKVNCIKENRNYFFIHSQAKVIETLGGSDYGE